MEQININELNNKILTSDLEGLYYQMPFTPTFSNFSKITRPSSRNICGLDARNYVRENFISHDFSKNRSIDKSYIIEFMLGENIPEQEKEIVSNYLDDDLKQLIFEKYIETELKHKNFKLDLGDLSQQLFYTPKINGVPLKNYYNDKKHNMVRYTEVCLEYQRCLEILNGNKENITSDEIICLKTLFNSNPYFQNKWCPDKIKKMNKELNSPYIENFINKVCSNNDYLIRKEIVDSQEFNHEYHTNTILKQSIFHSIPPNFSLLEKTIYIYSKLCKTLTYDPIYYMDNKNSSHQNVNNIETYDPSNNNVICYEFSYIFADLLRDLGVNQIKEEIPVENQFSNHHANISYLVDGLAVLADSTRTVNEGDLSQSKFTNDLTGIRCQLYDKSYQEKFKQAKEKVVVFLEKLEKEKEHMLPSKEKLKHNTKNEGTIMLNYYLLNCPLTNLDFISYAQKLISLLDLNIETKVVSVNGKQLFLNILLDNYDEYGNKTKISYLINCEDKMLYNNTNNDFIFQESLTTAKHH